MFTKQTFVQRRMRSLALKLFVSVENNGNTDFQKNGEALFFERVFNYLAQEYRDNLVVFDVGSNTGQYAQLIVDKIGHSDERIHLHLFEPIHSSFAALEQKFAGRSWITLSQVAISNVDGETKIYFDKEHSRWASLHRRNLAAYAVEMNKVEVVQTLRLDNYIASKNMHHVHFIKLDIEGHEMFALEGMGRYLDRAFVDFIQFEYGGANLDSHTSLMELFTLFEKKGFVVAKIMPGGLQIRSYQPWMDNFQYANYVAISHDIIQKLA
jgi:FkbM family methyltransferase